MFPQSLSPCSLRPKFKRRRLSQIPTPGSTLACPGDPPFATGAMAPVRLAAGAILALSGAASWLLPDPWTPPPLTAHAAALDSQTCAPESGGATSASSPPHARLLSRLVPLRRRNGRARRRLLAGDTFAFGDLDLLNGKFYGFFPD